MVLLLKQPGPMLFKYVRVAFGTLPITIIQAALAQKVSRERIGIELMKMLSSKLIERSQNLAN